MLHSVHKQYQAAAHTEDDEGRQAGQKFKGPAQKPGHKDKNQPYEGSGNQDPIEIQQKSEPDISRALAHEFETSVRKERSPDGECAQKNIGSHSCREDTAPQSFMSRQNTGSPENPQTEKQG
jgi:hypothetical protein